MITSYHIGCQISMTEDHSFGTSGRTGCIYNCSYILRCRHTGLAVTGELFIISLHYLESVEFDHQGHPGHDFLTDFSHKSFRHENDLAFRVIDDIGHLIFRAVRKNRDGYPSKSRCRKERDRPVRHTLRKNRHLVTGPDSVLCQSF